MNKEKLQLTAEEGRCLVWGELPGFKKISDKIITTTRWSTVHRLVVQRESDGLFFCDEYSRAATECQDERPYEYSEPDFTQVFPVEKKVIVYE